MCIPGTAISRYVNFYTDFAFKKIFGTEANKVLLIDFLNNLLEFTGDKEITDLSYLNAEQLGATAQERRAVYDVYCQAKDGSRFIVEMQKAEQVFFKDRSLFYSTFPIREQSVTGKDWDYKLSPVYVVGVLNFTFENNENEDVITRVNLRDEHGNIFNDNLNFVYLEMPKFHKKIEELSSLTDKWLFVMKNLYRLQNQPAALQNAVFNRLFEIAEISKYDKTELAEYEESLKCFRDWNNCLETADIKGYNRGHEEGLIEGKAEGLIEGKAEGLIEGKAEGLIEGKAEGLIEGKTEAKTEVARNMKRAGISAHDIAKFTGLSLKEIETL